MNRRGFISALTLSPLALTAMELSDLRNLSGNFSPSDRMPVLFVGHGSPMNGIENNSFSKTWQELPRQFPKPSAILCISAHWLTQGTFITAMDHPKTIHDFGGFPDALFQVQYPAPGKAQLAKETAQIVKKTQVGLDHDWGLDHGAWTVIRHMYPDASIPVFAVQVSITISRLRITTSLRKSFCTSATKVYSFWAVETWCINLRMVACDKMNTPIYGFDWGIEMNKLFRQRIAKPTSPY